MFPEWKWGERVGGKKEFSERKREKKGGEGKERERKRAALREHTVECELTVPWVCDHASALPRVPPARRLRARRPPRRAASVGLALGTGWAGAPGNTRTYTRTRCQTPTHKHRTETQTRTRTHKRTHIYIYTHTQSKFFNTCVYTALSLSHTYFKLL